MRLRWIFSAAFIMVLIPSMPAVGWASQRIAVFPFEDRSGFKGSWNLEKEMAVFLASRLSENPFYIMVPYDSIEALIPKSPKRKLSGNELVGYGASLGADYVISGRINDFNISRFSAGLPMLGGYVSYQAKVDLEIHILRVIDKAEVGVISGNGEISDRDLGMTLLGKPREKDLQFYGLDETPFGSREFERTIIGKATLDAVGELKEKIADVIRPPSLPEGIVGRVVSVSDDGSSVYLNLGSDDGVKIGDKFVIYSEGETLFDPVTGKPLGKSEAKVGVVQIIVVNAPHLSKAKIVQVGEKPIERGNIARPDKIGI